MICNREVYHTVHDVTAAIVGIVVATAVEVAVIVAVK